MNIQIYIGIDGIDGSNGQIVPVSDIEDLQSLYRIIGLTLKTKQSTEPRNIAQSHEESHEQLDKSVEPEIVHEDARLAGLDFAPPKTPIGETSYDYARKAGCCFDKPVNARLIAKKMLALGWKTTAVKSHTILSSARSAMKKVGFENTEGSEWFYPLALRTQVPENGQLPHPHGDDEM